MSWAKIAGGGSASVSLQVPKSHHYSIIGPRGSTVRALQSQHGVNIQIPRREDTSTLVRVSGADEDAVNSAKEAIEQILGFSLSEEPLVVSAFPVAPQFYGQLVGPKASTLRAKQREFGVSLFVPEQGSSRRTVVVQGSPDGVQRAAEWLGEVTGAAVEAQAPGQAQGEEESGDAGSGGVQFKESLSQPISEVLFFPDDDGSDGWNIDRFVTFLRSARKSLDICVFTITYNRIADAILREFREGTKVRVITDNDTASALGSDIDRLRQAGVPVRWDKTDAHMHHKFCVIDRKLVMNGSFNWTRSASTRNFENVMVTNEPVFVKQFAEHFDRMWDDYKSFSEA